MKVFIQNLIVEEDWQDLIECTLLAGFISLIAVGTITTIGIGVNQVYTNISNIAPLSGGGGEP